VVWKKLWLRNTWHLSVCTYGPSLFPESLLGKLSTTFLLSKFH